MEEVRRGYRGPLFRAPSPRVRISAGNFHVVWVEIRVGSVDGDVLVAHVAPAHERPGPRAAGIEGWCVNAAPFLRRDVEDGPRAVPRRVRRSRRLHLPDFFHLPGFFVLDEFFLRAVSRESLEELAAARQERAHGPEALVRGRRLRRRARRRRLRGDE